MNSGLVFVIEGPDGVGKSSVASSLSDHLESRKIPHSSLSFPGREVGTLGHLIYEFHHDQGRFGIEKVTTAALQSLHVAAHVDVIEQRIIPLLEANTHVILDRYWWSTLAYGLADGVDEQFLNKLIEVEKLKWGPHQPSLVLLIDRHSPIGRDEDLQKWQKIRQQYLKIASREQSKYPIKIIDNDKSLESLIKEVAKNVDKILE